jgi:hypothetical protein
MVQLLGFIVSEKVDTNTMADWGMIQTAPQSKVSQRII